MKKREIKEHARIFHAIILLHYLFIILFIQYQRICSTMARSNKNDSAVDSDVDSDFQRDQDDIVIRTRKAAAPDSNGNEPRQVQAPAPIKARPRWKKRKPVTNTRKVKKLMRASHQMPSLFNYLKSQDNGSDDGDPGDRKPAAIPGKNNNACNKANGKANKKSTKGKAKAKKELVPVVEEPLAPSPPEEEQVDIYPASASSSEENDVEEKVTTTKKRSTVATKKEKKTTTKKTTTTVIKKRKATTDNNDDGQDDDVVGRTNNMRNNSTSDIIVINDSDSDLDEEEVIVIVINDSDSDSVVSAVKDPALLLPVLQMTSGDERKTLPYDNIDVQQNR
jgi:hypothetical protein